MTNTHDVIPCRYSLIGYRKDNDRVQLMREIPIALWPLMGSLVGADWDDGYGEYPISQTDAETLAAAMKGNLKAHYNCIFHITSAETADRRWKHIWLDAADQLDEIAARLETGGGRVRDLLRGYALATRSLLYADVNGGLDEEYEDFPEAPKL